MQTLDARFKVVKGIANQSCTTTTIASATATLIKGSTVNLLPGEAGSGLAFRYKLAGTKTGTNAAHTVALYLGSTAVCTSTADDTSAVDWVAEFTIIFTSSATQRVMATMLSDTADPDVQYDTGTTNCSAGIAMTLKATSHASDSLTIDMITVEKWNYEPMSTA